MPKPPQFEIGACVCLTRPMKRLAASPARAVGSPGRVVERRLSLGVVGGYWYTVRFDAPGSDEHNWFSIDSLKPCKRCKPGTRHEQAALE